MAFDEKTSTSPYPNHPPPTKNDLSPVDDTSTPLIGKKSPGVVRIEALATQITFYDRIAIFFGVFLIAYAYGLDGTLRYAYQPYATSSFGGHSLLATVNTIRAVVAAAAQVCMATISEKDGIMELVFYEIRLKGQHHECEY
jgi:SIT family siderophore-iron:H+ symporter-like MFS transporter